MRLKVRVAKWLRVGVLAVAGLAGGLHALGAGAHPLRVQNGVLTVDGMTARTGVNLRIADLHYLYVAIPGAGTMVIAERPFAGAHVEEGAFRGSSLTVTAGGSRVQLTAANRFRSSRAAYVRFDREVAETLALPAVSYGDAAKVPAIWPDERMAPVTVRRRVVTKARGPRTAKLCGPARKGRNSCALVREVVYRAPGSRR
jgi:hypothetical protein